MIYNSKLYHHQHHKKMKPKEKAIKLAMNHIMVWGLKDKFLIESIDIALKEQQKEVFKVIDEWFTSLEKKSPSGVVKVDRIDIDGFKDKLRERWK